MTANIALSCLGVVFTLLWLWWVYYSVKTLRKFEKTTQDGEEVMIVREKVWQKSMARLLRRDEDDDVNGIKRIVTGGLIDLIEMESRRGSINRGPRGRGGGFAVGATTPRPSHESSRTSESGGRSHAGRTTPVFSDGDRPPYERNANDGARADVAPPPYIGQPANEGTHTTSSSGGTGIGTMTTTSTSMSNPNDSPLVRSGTIGSTATTNRPLPLAPPQIERVVERKMDEMAGGGTGTMEMDAYTATRLGLGPVIGGEGRTMESILDRKMDTFNQNQNQNQGTSGPSGSTGTSGLRGETMEQLVDRKITFAGIPPTGPSTSTSASGASPYSPNPNPTTPRQPHPHLPPRIHASSYDTPKGKAAEAGFTIQNPTSPAFLSDSPINTLSTSASSGGEMTLEEMIELKMAALRAASSSSSSTTTPHRPIATETHSGGVQKKRRRRKGKGKGRERAGSDPGPKLERFEESDDDSGDG
jgi:hypothetical protein